MPFVARQHGHAGDEGAVFADDERLLEQRIGQQRQLQVARRHLFAGGGDDDFLDAAQDADAALHDLGLVAGAQPAVGIENARRVLGALPVAAHHDGAAHLQFAVVADAHLDAGQRAAHGGRVVVVQAVDRHHRRRFGHAIALHQRQAQAQKTVRDGGRERRAAAHGHAHPAAEPGQHGLGHQRVQQRPGQGGHPATGAAARGHWQALRRAEAAPALVLGGLEQLHLPGRGRERLEQLGVHALVDARHRHQHGGAHGLQILGQLRHRARIGHAAARRHRQVVASRALKGVRQRQERQEHVVGGGRYALEHGFHVAEHIGVRQHHALGLARRARGVDDGRKVFGPRRGRQWSARRGAVEPLRKRAQRRRIGRCFCGLQGRWRVRHNHHRAQRRKRHAGRADRVPLRGLFHEEHGGFAVGQDVGDAAGVVDGVQRHRHAGGGQRGLVGAQGLQAIGQQDGDARADGQLHGGERAGPLGHALRGLRPAQADPGLRGGIERAVGLAVRGAGRAVGEQLGQRLDAGDVGKGRGHQVGRGKRSARNQSWGKPLGSYPALFRPWRPEHAFARRRSHETGDRGRPLAFPRPGAKLAQRRRPSRGPRMPALCRNFCHGKAHPCRLAQRTARVRFFCFRPPPRARARSAPASRRRWPPRRARASPPGWRGARAASPRCGPA